ncbi:MAG: hypothetical protein AAFU70_08975, partial [Planctomycetota bacterium]
LRLGRGVLLLGCCVVLLWLRIGLALVLWRVLRLVFRSRLGARRRRGRVGLLAEFVGEVLKVLGQIVRRRGARVGRGRLGLLRCAVELFGEAAEIVAGGRVVEVRTQSLRVLRGLIEIARRERFGELAGGTELFRLEFGQTLGGILAGPLGAVGLGLGLLREFVELLRRAGDRLFGVAQSLLQLGFERIEELVVGFEAEFLGGFSDLDLCALQLLLHVGDAFGVCRDGGKCGGFRRPLPRWHKQNERDGNREQACADAKPGYRAGDRRRRRQLKVASLGVPHGVGDGPLLERTGRLTGELERRCEGGVGLG